MTNQDNLTWLDDWKPIFVNGVIPSEFRQAIAAKFREADRAARISQANIALYGTQYEFDGKMYVSVEKLQEQLAELEEDKS